MAKSARPAVPARKRARRWETHGQVAAMRQARAPLPRWLPAPAVAGIRPGAPSPHGGGERGGEGGGPRPAERVTFADGAEEVVDIVYHLPSDRPRHELAVQLGAELQEDGSERSGRFGP